MQGAVAMETVVMIAIGVLGIVFMGALLTLVLVCRHKYCRKADLISRQTRDTRPDVNLVDHMEGVPEGPHGVELDDVRFNPSLEQLLQDADWVNDATGLAPHCLEILKICHTLTEKLVGITMGNSQQLRNPERLVDIVSIAKQISPGVDDVVRSMYPPLDPRLLEARCKSLVLSVSYLVLITKSACRLSGVADWIDQSLADVQDHLKILREASVQYEAVQRATEMQQQQQLQQQQQFLQQPGNNPNNVSIHNEPQVLMQNAPQRNDASDV